MNDYGLHYWMIIGQSHLHRQIARQVCSPDGLLPGQPKILEFLARHDGCTQKEIGRGCALDKSTVTSLLGRMAEAGLVRKQAGQNDRRTVRICLTPEGWDKAHAVLAVFSDVDKRAWQGVEPAGQAQFLKTLRQIISNLEGMDEE